MARWSSRTGRLSQRKKCARCCGAFTASMGQMEILSTSPRPFSAAGVVAAGSSRVFVKRHHRSVRDREGLLEEHRFIAHLRAHHLPTPEVLQTEDGETAIEAGEWTYEVHEIPAGVDLYQDAHSWTPFRSLEHARSAGRMLARLHIAARDFTAPRRKPRPLVAGFTIFAAGDPADAMREYLRNARHWVLTRAAQR